MDKAKVYFTDFRTQANVPLTAKLQKAHPPGGHRGYSL